MKHPGILIVEAKEQVSSLKLRDEDGRESVLTPSRQ